MSTTLITATAIPKTNAGFNLSDATFTTMSTGAGNGVTFLYSNSNVIVMKNTTGGAAVYTLKIPTISTVSAVGATITDPTNSVATLKTEVLMLPSIFQDSTGYATIECDVAGSILVLST